MLNKILSFVLVSVMLLSLAGCGIGDTAEKSSSITPDETVSSVTEDAKGADYSESSEHQLTESESTPTAEPTAEPEPETTDTSTEEEMSTATPSPTAEPTSTPKATVTPKTEATEKPTAVPTAEPVSTATPTVTTTPKPTVTPKPTATPKPTVTTTPEATAPPKATATPKPTEVPTPEPPAGNDVWIPTNGGTKYHSKSSCSNMKDPIKVSLDYAISNGFEACKKCY